MTDVDGMRQARISAHLVIGGPAEFDPDDCTKAIGVAPTSIWRQRHEQLLNRTDLNAVEWMHGFTKEPFDDTDKALRRVLDAVWPHRTAIKSFVEECQLRGSFTCNITITHDRPLYRIGPKTLNRLAFFSFELGFDIFDYSE